MRRFTKTIARRFLRDLVIIIIVYIASSRYGSTSLDVSDCSVVFFKLRFIMSSGSHSPAIVAQRFITRDIVII